MEISLRDGIYYVSGDITETCELATAKLPQGAVRLDLGGVRTINSCGVREWISWIGKLGIQPVYINCPQPVVMQFNMVREFLANNARVESFMVPAYCETCSQQKNFLLRSGVEFKPGEPLEDFEIPKCAQAGCAIEADVDFDSYLYFIEDLVQ